MPTDRTVLLAYLVVVVALDLCHDRPGPRSTAVLREEPLIARDTARLAGHDAELAR